MLDLPIVYHDRIDGKSYPVDLMTTMTAPKHTPQETTVKPPRPDRAPKTPDEMRTHMQAHLKTYTKVYKALGRGA